MLLRLSVPPRDDAERALLASREVAVIPEPTYGTQLQDFGVQGMKAEGQLRVDYAELPVVPGDGGW